MINPINKDNNYNYFMNGVPKFMNMNKIYKCLNCKNSYLLNDCFNQIENKNYIEHSFRIENSDTKDNNDNKNIIKENKDDKNIKILDNYIGNEKKENKKNENKNHEIKNIKHNKKKIKEDKDEKKEDYNNDFKFYDILDQYFLRNYNKKFNLIIRYPTDEELNQVKEFYISLLKNNTSIQDIEESQNIYIQNEIKPKMERLGNANIIKFNMRLEKINNLIKDLNK